MVDFDLFLSSYQSDKDKIIFGFYRIIDLIDYYEHIHCIDNDSACKIISNVYDALKIFKDKCIDK